MNKTDANDQFAHDKTLTSPFVRGEDTQSACEDTNETLTQVRKGVTLFSGTSPTVPCGRA